MGLLLRTSLLINGILFNTEALMSLQDKHITMLENCDKYLLRKLFSTNISTPTESLYIESGAMRIRFIVQGRRLMYYWSLLHRNNDNLAKQVFLAMKEFHGKRKDFVQQINEDKYLLNIQNSEEEIMLMSRSSFKSLIEKKIKFLSMFYFTKLQMKHS